MHKVIPVSFKRCSSIVSQVSMVKNMAANKNYYKKVKRFVLMKISRIHSDRTTWRVYI